MMDTQVISESDIGLNNAALAESTSRIIQGGTWKKQRIVVLMPTADLIHARIFLALRNLIFPPNQPCTWMPITGHEVGVAYSETIGQILAHPELGTWEYLLTVEHDNAPPADGVLKLIKRMEEHPELACIGGLYWTKGLGTGVPQIWGDPTDPVLNFRPQAPDPAGGLVECCGTGMGFNLWRLSMFRDERLPKPLFKTKQSLEEGVGTQDLAFWTEARKHGYRCAVDCSVLVGHYDAATDTMY
jgi:hypothetical protein